MESDSLVQKVDRASDFWFNGPGVRLPGPFSGSKNGWTAAIVSWLRSTRSISLFQHIHK